MNIDIGNKKQEGCITHPSYSYKYTPFDSRLDIKTRSASLQFIPSNLTSEHTVKPLLLPSVVFSHVAYPTVCP